MKYCDSGKAKSEEEAIELLWEEYLLPLRQETYQIDPYFYDYHRWRVERYWNEPCDNLYKAYANLFQQIFNHYGSKNRKPGAKITVTLDEFTDLINEAGLINDCLNARDVGICFS